MSDILCQYIEMDGSQTIPHAQQGSQCRCRQAEIRVREHLSPVQCFFAVIFHITYRVDALRIGRPRAARIISRVHPAQQRYLRGSPMEMARLSPFLSRPCCAQEGQRV